MYGYLIGDVTEEQMEMMLDDLNTKHCTIVGCCYAPETHQIIIIYDEPKEKEQPIGLLRQQNE